MAVGLLDLCEEYFGARDFYDVLKISKTANEKQGECDITSRDFCELFFLRNLVVSMKLRCVSSWEWGFK